LAAAVVSAEREGDKGFDEDVSKKNKKTLISLNGDPDKEEYEPTYIIISSDQL
jgi:hypothetical protein